MDYSTIKLSDVTNALKKAGFTKVDGESAIFGNMQGRERCFYKYHGALYVNGHKIGFCINSKADAKIFGKYSVSAIDASGATSEKLTDWPQFFFSRLFGYLNGEISEAEIIADICS